MPDNHTTSDTETNLRSISTRLHEFDPNDYDWDDWEVLFDTHLAVVEIKDENKKRNLLITHLGVQAFKTLIVLCKPKKPIDYSYEELVMKLRSNYARITFPSTEQIKFFSKRQGVSQTLTGFANDLRDKASTCNFPSDYYEQALITAFVGGLVNAQVRKHLMQRGLDTFETTINAAKTIESVLSEGAQIKSHSTEELSINKINRRHPQQNTKSFNKSACASCGSHEHVRAKCRFRYANCHKCKINGHIAKVCRSKESSSKHMNTLFSSTMGKITIDRPIQMDLMVKNSKVKFQVDTGSPVTLINEKIWNEIGRTRLEPCQVKLHSFTGHSIDLAGQQVVKVFYDDKQFDLTVYVIKGSGINVLGRDWLDCLNLRMKTLQDIDSN
jgi:predicted aspartyl protease